MEGCPSVWHVEATGSTEVHVGDSAAMIVDEEQVRAAWAEGVTALLDAECDLDPGGADDERDAYGAVSSRHMMCQNLIIFQ